MNQTNARIICEIKCMHILRFGKSCFYGNKWSKIDMNELTRWNLNWYFWKRKEKKNTDVINECHLNKYPANACDTHRHTGNTNLSNGNKVLRCSWTRQGVSLLSSNMCLSPIIASNKHFYEQWPNVIIGWAMNFDGKSSFYAFSKVKKKRKENATIKTHESIPNWYNPFK